MSRALQFIRTTLIIVGIAFLVLKLIVPGQVPDWIAVAIIVAVVLGVPIQIALTWAWTPAPTEKEMAEKNRVWLDEINRDYAPLRTVEDRLDELERLKRRDMVTPEEYAAKRQDILKDL
jgi:hypothetical protein